MPELPEVQTVVSQLDKKISGKRIASVWSDWQKKIYPSFKAFSEEVQGARVKGVRRLGKHVVIDLDNGRSIVAHLKMTGHFLIKTKKNRKQLAFTEDRMNGYIHHILAFADGTTAEFSDMRKFGWLRALPTDVVEALPSIASLGIDALSPALTAEKFRALFEKRGHRLIAPLLLEQHIVSGIGNIYRSEGLFLAGILPDRLTDSLSRAEWQKLYASLRRVLRQAVKLRGTSDGDFRDTDGLAGTFQKTLHVYRREGLPCKKCGTILKRKKMGQRSVYFCPVCQK
ncbi:MAG: bifunctional DNA-formamidopyrimidine glycosylase/DNA-(apurinic or apyrimidinic site) lyase [Candidatus Moraniibacteriota bacterium]